MELRPAAIELIRTLAPNMNLTSEVLSLEDPLVVLAYDEAHALAIPEAAEGDDPTPTAFSEHRHVLRMLRKIPIFALFLSTIGKIHDLTPPTTQARLVR